jgi:hypothetical protein
VCHALENAGPLQKALATSIWYCFCCMSSLSVTVFDLMVLGLK